MMTRRQWVCCGLMPLWMGVAWAQGEQSVYCPQNHTYISVGMTTDQVLIACGQPAHQEKSHTPMTKKVPMMQLIYNSKGSATAFYGVWALPVGVTTGSTLEIDIVDNKVYAVRMNSMGSKAFSVCGGVSIVVGDPVSKVYSACGTPAVLNDTYIEKREGPAVYPEIWTYDIPYQPSIRLTFVNGKLDYIQ